MNILIAIALGGAFLGIIGLGIFMLLAKKLMKTEDSLFENLDEEHAYSRKEHCDEYSAGVFHW